MNEESLAMLRDLSEAPGLPGYEREVRQIIRRYAAPYADIEYDGLGSIVCRKTGKSQAPRIMLAGHMDEVGFIVTYITEQGFIKFQTVGGWFEQVLLAQRVIVKTSKGDVPGIIGSKPPHLMSDDDRKKVVKIKDMFIDVGASSRQEAESFGIRPGDPIIPYSPFMRLKNEKMLLGKAWDDRVGCALLVEVLKQLFRREHPNTVYAVGTVQEEVGLRGATTSAYMVDPDVGFALEVDVSGGTPGIEDYEALSRLGKGPSITIYDASMVPNTKLRDLVADIASRNGIPIQFNYMARGGTDAGRIHLTRRGVPSLVIGVPSRYIHSHVGIIHLDDYLAAATLMTEVICALDESLVKSLNA